MKKIALVLPLLVVLASCSSSFGKGAKAGAETLYHCEKANLEALVDQQGATLLGKATDIVLNGFTGWEGELEQLGIKVGELSLACAVEAVRAGLIASRHFETAPDAPAQRAAAFIAAHGWKFAPPQ